MSVLDFFKGTPRTLKFQRDLHARNRQELADTLLALIRDYEDATGEKVIAVEPVVGPKTNEDCFPYTESVELETMDVNDLYSTEARS